MHAGQSRSRFVHLRIKKDGLNQLDFGGRADPDPRGGARLSENLSSCGQGKKLMIFIVDDDEEAKGFASAFCLNAQA